MNKLGRAYRLTISSDDFDDIVIQNPITIQFTVNRRQFSAVNQMSCDLYNLDRSTRDILFQQPWAERRKKVVFEGGYDELSTLFTGDVWECYSYREGPDIITHIESRSTVWDLEQTTVYETLDAGMTVRDVIENLAGRFPTLKVGAIGEFPEKILRPCVLNGNCWNLLKDYSDGTAFVDNGKIYVLKRDEVIDGDILQITPQSGLLATPRQIERGVLQIQTLFEPRIIIDQMIDLKAESQTIFNGGYKVFGVQHSGIISNSVGGDLRTMIDLFLGGTTFKTVPISG